MGLSASQAKLLTITSRLADNELRAQFITNSKVRLADDSNEASAEYMRALDSTNFMYAFYDANGDKNNIKLTAGTVMEYNQLKNQYGLIDRYGRILVSSDDVNKYTNAGSLTDFWKAYGVEDFYPQGFEGKTQIVLSKNASMQTETNTDTAAANALTAATSSLDAAKLLDESRVDNLNKEGLIERAEAAKQAALDVVVLQRIVSVANEMNILITEIAQKVADATKNAVDCTAPSYSGTKDTNNDGTATIAEMRQWQDNAIADINTKAQDLQGKKATLDSKMGTLTSDLGLIQNPEMKAAARSICNAIIAASQPAQDAIDATNNFYTVANDNYKRDTASTDDLIIKAAYGPGVSYGGGTTTEQYRTASNGGAYGLSRLAFDALPAINTSIDNAGVLELAKQIAADTAEIALEAQMLCVDKKDSRCEWYTNLWYRMGSTDATHKAPNSAAYTVLDEKYMNNEAWLKYALENGIISMEQVIFNEQGSTTTPALQNREWKSIKYSASADITEQEDKTRVARAEIKYEKSLREIQAKDKQYDQDLKKLDTQHNSLQTEYDSLKSVIDKNVERSFKAFS
jgi:hypothetical protein